jgi:hypothetical protein
MNQEVVDGLVEAVEKKDVLYVLVYLDDMREQGWLEQGVNAKRESAMERSTRAITDDTQLCRFEERLHSFAVNVRNRRQKTS